MSFQDKLIYVRATLNLTQTELANELKVSFPTISRWENGKSNPTKKALVIFANFCRKHNIRWDDSDE